jgi:RNA polymerase sigma-70 factor (sigma-E family)
VADEELELLVRTHEAALLRLAFLLCHDSARAEDLVQEALVRVLRRWRSAGVAEHPLAYARKTLVNEYLAWRRLRWASEVVGDIDDAAVADQADELAERDLMWRLLAELSPRSRTVLVLRYYEHLPDTDIAVVIGARQATVRSIAARALSVLRAHPSLIAAMEEA